jgi:hypothetical protein
MNLLVPNYIHTQTYRSTDANVKEQRGEESN